VESDAQGATKVIALDTHALLWMAFEPTKLSIKARRAIEDADRIGISAIVFWEVALLAERHRIDLKIGVNEWTREVLALARFEALPVTADIAVEAATLPMHRDPADRLIVSTARQNRCPLVTRDKAIHEAGLTRVIW
jgi:PIN domain nuclease of toxin-antitoxin system